MATVVLTDGFDSEGTAVVLVVDQEGTPQERAVAGLGARGYEGDECLYLVQTDGWVDRRVVGDVLTLDVVLAGETGPTVLLSVTTRVDPVAYARAGAETVVLVAAPGESAGSALDTALSGEEWPLIVAPAP
ncbi:hypothetical protein [Actinosynnema sp. NPDC020468]|uniref:hypothetical protein n=1 Tax=Actinosynnema sp. NPDC020468 TaxID=3154488 RepID=UPI0033F375DD